MIKLTKPRFKLSSAGDTIPEVLISLAVMGLMIVSAYILTNQSQSRTQSAHERSEASKIADGQVELLRNYADKNKLPKNDYFCFKYDEATDKINLISISSDLSADGAVYPEECSSGPESRYTFAIWSPSKAHSDTDVGGNGSSFAVIVRWDGLNVQSEEVKKFYEIYDASDDAFKPPTAPLTPEPECNDSYDNSDPEDTLADENDPACFSDGIATGSKSSPTFRKDNSEVNPQCNNGINDDAPEDGKTDWPDDLGCTGLTDNDEKNPVCIDGKDNDIDGKTDYPADPGCSSALDTDEYNPPECSDGKDNDGDGYKDFPADASCDNASDDDELNPLPPARDALYACYFWNEYVPYVGWKNLIRTNHRYSTDPNDCAGAGNGPGILGYVPKAGQPGSVPMYGGFHAGIEDDFYTTSWAEYATAVSWGWSGGAGVKFYVYPDCKQKGTVGLYRWYSGFVGNHVYLLSGQNPNDFSAVDGGGTYVYEGLAGCILAGTYP